MQRLPSERREKGLREAAVLPVPVAMGKQREACPRPADRRQHEGKPSSSGLDLMRSPFKYKASRDKTTSELKAWGWQRWAYS